MTYLLIFMKARFTAGEVLGEEILGKPDSHGSSSGSAKPLA